MKEPTYPMPPEGGGAWTAESFAPERIGKLIADLIPTDEERRGRNFGLHIIDGEEEASDIARYVEATVFYDAFKNDLDTMREEYAKFDGSSTFLLVLDYENKAPIGTIRIIRPSDSGLKSFNDLIAEDSPWSGQNQTATDRWHELGDDPDHTVDIATMAVMPNYRSGHTSVGASASLYSSCVRWSLQNGFNNWITIVDKSIYDMMQAWGEPFTPFQGAEFAPYLDSAESLPVYTELNSGLERIRQFDQPTEIKPLTNIHGLYTQGAGLEGIFVLPGFTDNVQ